MSESNPPEVVYYYLYNFHLNGYPMRWSSTSSFKEVYAHWALYPLWNSEAPPVPLTKTSAFKARCVAEGQTKQYLPWLNKNSYITLLFETGREALTIFLLSPKKRAQALHLLAPKALLEGRCLGIITEESWTRYPYCWLPPPPPISFREEHKGV